MAAFKLKKLDEQPPKPTGNPNTDLIELSKYCTKLIEIINYNYYIIEKEINK